MKVVQLRPGAVTAGEDIVASARWNASRRFPQLAEMTGLTVRAHLRSNAFVQERALAALKSSQGACSSRKRRLAVSAAGSGIHSGRWCVYGMAPAAGLPADFGAEMTRQRAPGHRGALAAWREARAISGSARRRKAGRQMHAGDFTREASGLVRALHLVFPNPVLTPRTGSSLATIPSIALRAYLNCRNGTHGHLWLLARCVAHSGTS
jgi:hypothetical protein